MSFALSRRTASRTGRPSRSPRCESSQSTPRTLPVPTTLGIGRPAARAATSIKKLIDAAPSRSCRCRRRRPRRPLASHFLPDPAAASALSVSSLSTATAFPPSRVFAVLRSLLLGVDELLDSALHVARVLEHQCLVELAVGEAHLGERVEEPFPLRGGGERARARLDVGTVLGDDGREHARVREAHLEQLRLHLVLGARRRRGRSRSGRRLDLLKLVVRRRLARGRLDVAVVVVVVLLRFLVLVVLVSNLVL